MRMSRGQPAYQRGEHDTEKRRDEQIGGIWWLLDHEDLSSHGTARMFADGLVWLDLDSDAWRDVLDGEAQRGPRTVFGETSAGVPMSLHGVRFIGGQSEESGAHVRYVSERLIFGAHAASEDDVSVSGLSVSFRGLREWLLSATQGEDPPLPFVYPAALAASATVDSEDANDGAEEVAEGDNGTAASDDKNTADQDEDEDEDEDEDDGVSAPVDDWERRLEIKVDGVTLIITAGKHPRETGRYRTVFDTSAAIRLHSPEPITLAEWRQGWIEPLRDLVLFGTREQTVLLFFRGRPTEEDPRSEIRVYSPPDVTIGPPDHAEYYQRDLLPSGIWGEDGFVDLIKTWRELYMRLGSVATSLFEAFNMVDMPPLTRLLRLTACAEGYHRVLHDELPFAPAEHERMVDAMINALPQNRQTREHYRSRMTHANSQSQRKRLRWLIERASEADTRLDRQASVITGQLVDWRNEQTHLDEAQVAPPLDDLLLLNAILTYVLEANILLDLGLGDETGRCLAYGHAWDDPLPTWLDSHPTARGQGATSGT